MSSAVRSHGYVMLLAVGLAGCTPAAFIQRVRSPQPCEVQVCTNFGASGRCECKTTEQWVRQSRHNFWPHEID
jgi:hypothetical protein